MGLSKLFTLSCVALAFFIVTPEPARDSPTKLGDPVTTKTTSTIKTPAK